MTVISEFEGLADAENYFRVMPERSAKAARLAINQTIARKGMKLVQDDMYSQIAFPKGYLKGDRLHVSKFATESDLTGVILARKRATSLARFAASGTPVGSKSRSGVQVVVRSGKSIHLENAWLVRLNKGASLTDDQFNVGLAVRVKPGDSIMHKSSTHKAWLIPGSVALLYGPSVEQVFGDVAEHKGQQILSLVGDEFFRQFERAK